MNLTNLQKKILACIGTHSKVEISGFVKTFPQYSKYEILKNLLHLKKNDWIKIRKSYIIDGMTYPRPIAYRTKKQLRRNICGIEITKLKLYEIQPNRD